MVDQVRILEFWPDQSAVSSWVEYKARPATTCCGTINKPSRRFKVRFSQQFPNGSPRPWAPDTCGDLQPLHSSASRAIVHELGHTMSFRDVDGSGAATVMDALAGCRDWPMLVDGQALSCQFTNYYDCACQ